jgi:Fe-S-cluster containining protein
MVSNGVNFDEYGFRQVFPDDYFNYECSCCGDCCRNVKSSVMAESLDLYRLAKLLKMELGDVVLQYTDTVFLAWGFPVLMMKTKPYMDSCIFLRSSRCRAQSAKPRACRLYPLGVGPDDGQQGAWSSFIVSKNQHRFTGERRRIGDWINEHFTVEDKSFVSADYTYTGELAKLIKRVDRQNENDVIKLMLFFKFIFYDMSEDFMPQYIRNMEQLKKRLKLLERT